MYIAVFTLSPRKYAFYDDSMYVILVSSAGTFFSVCDNRQDDKTVFFLHSVKSLCPGFEATALNFGECEKLCFQVS